MNPPHDERKRQQALVKALELLERNPKFPNAQVQIHDWNEEAERNAPEEANERLSEARFLYCAKLLENQGIAFLPLVMDLESHKAFTAVIGEATRWTFFLFSGIPIDTVPSTLPFAQRPTPPLLLYRDKLVKKMLDYVNEGYRQLNSLQAANPLEPRANDGLAERPATKTISDQLDEAALKENISHEEQAARIGISRTTYFEVKAGRGGRKARRSTEMYLSRIFPEYTGPNPD